MKMLLQYYVYNENPVTLTLTLTMNLWFPPLFVRSIRFSQNMIFCKHMSNCVKHYQLYIVPVSVFNIAQTILQLNVGPSKKSKLVLTSLVPLFFLT